jgi:hypothetical protein
MKRAFADVVAYRRLPSHKLDERDCGLAHAAALVGSLIWGAGIEPSIFDLDTLAESLQHSTA